MPASDLWLSTQEVQASEDSCEDFTAVPAAPQFNPLPTFQATPAPRHGLLTDDSTGYRLILLPAQPPMHNAVHAA